ncbi:hypothetical protein [Flammeovirga sp. EKP202]|uniref:hypothetical protein n=1 Tax=Flammeovirga sp. EKP202 TaxID=2770592 RepID=UPI00165F4CD4|nr:hypothetical protein [Flammeovirga sp. EKP202]MBD0403799.1 hypothetical protein [Flammeovirga sp. EKP202]
MKSLTLIIALLYFTNLVAHAQRTSYKEITVDQFDDYEAFVNSPPPHITGKGIKSDSLSYSNLVYEYYEAEDQYYAIESWADYYYWLSKKYTYLFNKPEIFEHFYQMKDNVQMIKYLSFNYSVWHFPSSIKIKPHEALATHENRLSISYHIIKSEDDIEYMEDQLKLKKEKFQEVSLKH